MVHGTRRAGCREGERHKKREGGRERGRETHLGNYIIKTNSDGPLGPGESLFHSNDNKTTTKWHPSGLRVKTEALPRDSPAL